MKQPVLVKSELDQQVAELATGADHRALAVWAADCAARALPYFEHDYPHDPRPALAIAAARQWAEDGIFRMADVRGASLAAHAAARQVPDYQPARSAARAAGQAIATAHVPAHAQAAAIYAATAVRDAAPEPRQTAAVLRERQWQLDRLRELL